MLPCVFLYLFLKYLPLEAKAGLLGWLGPLPDENGADVPLWGASVQKGPCGTSLGAPAVDLAASTSEVVQVQVYQHWG